MRIAHRGVLSKEDTRLTRQRARRDHRTDPGRGDRGAPYVVTGEGPRSCRGGEKQPPASRGKPEKGKLLKLRELRVVGGGKEEGRLGKSWRIAERQDRLLLARIGAMGCREREKNIL